MTLSRRRLPSLSSNPSAGGAPGGEAAPIGLALLGPIQLVEATGETTSVRSSLGRAVLAALALADGRPRSVDGLVDDVWGDEPPQNPRASLQTLVSRIRALERSPIIESTAAGYRLASGRSAIDLLAAEAALARLAPSAGSDAATPHGPEIALAEAETALALWRGEPAADLPPTAPVAVALAHRAERARGALRRIRARALAAIGRADEASSAFDEIAQAEPFDEGAQLEAMKAAVDAGRFASALQRFADHRNLLAERLGTDPSPALVEANAEILRASSSQRTPSEHPGQQSQMRRPAFGIGLRQAPNDMIGRDGDARRVLDLLGRHRLVTLLGSGGLGKTRLAQDVAARAALAGSSVAVVELASIASGDDVGLLIASTLGIREVQSARRIGDPIVVPDVRRRILDALVGNPAHGAQPTLLVLDNCEHVIDAAAIWAADLVAASTELTILCTSRSPLSIAAEQVYPLQPLPSASDDASPAAAVTLFVDRARAARPSVRLPLNVVERLCSRLDGLPLAIELAAARVRSFSVEEIEGRLVDRFGLLTSGDRSAPERHRTLLAVIEWSWNLLHDDEQQLLVRLSRFADGFSLRTAETMMRSAGREGAAADALDGLVLQSLVVVTDTAQGTRYRMLETVREFGNRGIGSIVAEEELARHERQWAIGLALDSADLWFGSGRGGRLRDSPVSIEQDNLVAVLRRAIVDGEQDAAIGVYAVLAYLWTLRGAHSEVLAFGASVMAMLRGYRPAPAVAQLAVLALVITAATFGLFQFSTTVRAIVLLRRLVDRVEVEYPQLQAMARLVLSIEDLPAAYSAVEDTQASPDARTAILGNVMGAQLAENGGDVEGARVFALRARELAEQIGDEWGATMSAQMLVLFSSEAGDWQGVLDWAPIASEGLRDMGAFSDLHQLTWAIAIARIGMGELDEADALLREVIAVEGGLDDGMLALNGQAGLGEVELARAAAAARAGDHAAAARHRALGIEGYRTSVDLSRSSAQRLRPEAIIALAILVATECQALSADAVDAEVLRDHGRDLRIRLLVEFRRRSIQFDRPVLGTATVAMARWALDARDEPELAAELLALASGISPRQDSPSMRIEQHVTHVRAAVGADSYDRMLAASGRLTRDERVARIAELLSSPALRG
ncbi:Predicted ATPase [Agreia bicolorata]|uniref:Predicted ATPase n=1 Tax=Agreia bicolorata TaxID=110935 RepID=A0A1T4XHR3_9MICO|nr:BTAD domain-containing putative transcriptional regulator [Agreia bicolorata]SKA89017.1 Predicted ATPase [Agreia bicolorata]